MDELMYTKYQFLGKVGNLSKHVAVEKKKNRLMFHIQQIFFSLRISLPMLNTGQSNTVFPGTTGRQSQALVEEGRKIAKRLRTTIHKSSTDLRKWNETGGPILPGLTEREVRSLPYQDPPVPEKPQQIQQNDPMSSSPSSQF